MYDVRLNGYTVNFTAVDNAIEYVINTYLGESLVRRDNTTTNSAVVRGISPSENEYSVSVAYRTPLLSGFSNIFTTSKIITLML